MLALLSGESNNRVDSGIIFKIEYAMALLTVRSGGRREKYYNTDERMSKAPCRGLHRLRPPSVGWSRELVLAQYGWQ